MNPTSVATQWGLEVQPQERGQGVCARLVGERMVRTPTRSALLEVRGGGRCWRPPTQVKRLQEARGRGCHCCRAPARPHTHTHTHTLLQGSAPAQSHACNSQRRTAARTHTHTHAHTHTRTHTRTHTHTHPSVRPCRLRHPHRTQCNGGTQSAGRRCRPRRRRPRQQLRCCCCRCCCYCWGRPPRRRQSPGAPSGSPCPQVTCGQTHARAAWAARAVGQGPWLLLAGSG